MKFSTALLLPFSLLVSGFPAADSGEVKPSDWRPKGENEVRSPCPALNSLANHGFLPHSGKHITLPMLKKAFKTGINVGPDFAEFAGKMGIMLSMNKGKDFDLNDLNVHNAIEHDSSLTRQDAHFGDFHTFDRQVYEGTAKFFNGKEINHKIMAQARCARIRDSMKRNPDFDLNGGHRLASYIESSLIVSIFGDPHTGVVKHPNYVKYWMLNRRLPYELGWHPRSHETNVTTLMKMAKRVMYATPKDCKGRELGADFDMPGSTMH